MTELEQIQHMQQMQEQLNIFWAGNSWKKYRYLGSWIQSKTLRTTTISVGAYQTHYEIRRRRTNDQCGEHRFFVLQKPVKCSFRLTMRSWGIPEKRASNVAEEDIQMAIQNTDIFDFLVDVIIH
jgi:hypothetical protein